MLTNRLTTKPLQEVVAAIDALDLDSVKARVVDPKLGEGWTREYADSIEIAYKTYLKMLAKYQEDAEDIMLAKDVDEFWHAHILQTVKYTEDCERVFGTYLHHNPHVGPVTQRDLDKRETLAAKTRALYEQEFGAACHTAWAGSASSTPARAYSAATMTANAAAYSAAAGLEANAPYSAAAIERESQRDDTAGARDRAFAYSAGSIGRENAAYSAASIAATDAAYSAAAVERETQRDDMPGARDRAFAYSAASIGTANAAYSAAAISRENGAYSAASVRPVNPAVTGAAIQS